MQALHDPFPCDTERAADGRLQESGFSELAPVGFLAGGGGHGQIPRPADHRRLEGLLGASLQHGLDGPRSHGRSPAEGPDEGPSGPWQGVGQGSGDRHRRDPGEIRVGLRGPLPLGFDDHVPAGGQPHLAGNAGQLEWCGDCERGEAAGESAGHRRYRAACGGVEDADFPIQLSDRCLRGLAVLCGRGPNREAIGVHRPGQSRDARSCGEQAAKQPRAGMGAEGPQSPRPLVRHFSGCRLRSKSAVHLVVPLCLRQLPGTRGAGRPGPGAQGLEAGGVLWVKLNPVPPQSVRNT